jgi:hypothetical protein
VAAAAVEVPTAAAAPKGRAGRASAADCSVVGSCCRAAAADGSSAAVKMGLMRLHGASMSSGAGLRRAEPFGTSSGATSVWVCSQNKTRRSQVAGYWHYWLVIESALLEARRSESLLHRVQRPFPAETLPYWSQRTVVSRSVDWLARPAQRLGLHRHSASSPRMRRFPHWPRCCRPASKPRVSAACTPLHPSCASHDGLAAAATIVVLLNAARWRVECCTLCLHVMFCILCVACSILRSTFLRLRSCRSNRIFASRIFES